MDFHSIDIDNCSFYQLREIPFNFIYLHPVLIWRGSPIVIGQRVLSIVGFGNDVGIWEGSIVYKVLYFVFEEEAIVDFVVGFLVVMAIFIEVPSGRYEIRHGCGV